MQRSILVLITVLLHLPLQAQEEARVQLQSTVTGNQEQPKVLYIVPWQGPGGADHLRQSLQPIVDDILISVDRDEFRRELEYRAAARAAE
jgi:hypothetical protein